MADAGFDPVVFRLGRGMKTRPAILRNSTKAAVTDVKQTGPDETDSVSKGPVAQLQASALKRTTCGDITNVCVNQASCVSRRRTKSTMKAPRKQPMRSKREAGAPESTNEDLLSWFLEDDGLSPVTEVVAETQSPESTGVSQSLLEESVPPQPRLFHLSVVCSLEEPVMPAVYAEDIYNYMTQREESCELRLETLYLAVKMVDRFLSKQLCGRDTLQLVGATCLLIAAKFEEFCPLYVDDFLYICDGSYRREEMLKMERQILQVLDFDINAPTAYHFLRHFGKCTAVGLKTLTLARYICELTLQDYSYVGEWASSVASAVLCLAIRMDSLEGQPRTLQQPAGYVRRKTHGLLGRLNQMVREQPHKKLRVIYSKYSRRLSFEVAKIPALGTVGLEELVSGEEIS
ncbi:G2/mitotic-specific cyclin-B3-like isoform X2 [Pristis pectinata]|uniref:G2/mitotic-specific cyclin-B3-like isoform X2 n=1 Tax=Pristis pectinata TaxID=685728 RepID=UPI00223C9C40|nr:G2/mitotic-specific cyclin-B3-like isoform X2 [Pristis pectinata]